jgi:hypothetical protein
MPERSNKVKMRLFIKRTPKSGSVIYVPSVIDLEPAQEHIEPVRGLLVEAYQAATARWVELLTEHAALSVPLDKTTRANIIHDHLCAEIAQRFHGHPDIEATDALDFFALRWLDGSILLRFKYLRYGRPSNVKTARQHHLARQTYTPEMLLVLTGDPSFTPPTLLTCGYTLDGAELGRVEIRRDCKHHQPWSFHIYGGEALVEPLVLDGLADTAKPATVTSKTKRPKHLRVVTDEE